MLRTQGQLKGDRVLVVLKERHPCRENRQSRLEVLRVEILSGRKTRAMISKGWCAWLLPIIWR